MRAPGFHVLVAVVISATSQLSCVSHKDPLVGVYRGHVQLTSSEEQTLGKADSRALAAIKSATETLEIRKDGSFTRQALIAGSSRSIQGSWKVDGRELILLPQNVAGTNEIDHSPHFAISADEDTLTEDKVASHQPGIGEVVFVKN